MHAAQLATTPAVSPSPPTPNGGGLQDDITSITDTLTSVGVAMLTLLAVAAAVLVMVRLLQLRRRRQIVVPPLVNATGSAALDGTVGEGLTALLREMLDRAHRSVHAYLTWKLLPDEGPDRQRVDDLIRAYQPQPAQEVASNTASTLVTSLASAVPEAQRPMATLLGEVLTRPRGWRVKTYLRREPLAPTSADSPLTQVSFSFVIEDLAGIRPSRPVPVPLGAPAAPPADVVPVPPGALTSVQANGRPGPWLTPRVAGGRRSTAPATSSSPPSTTPSLDLTTSLRVLAQVIVVEVMRAELTASVNRAGPLRRLRWWVRRDEARTWRDGRTGAVENLCGLIYYNSVGSIPEGDAALVARASTCFVAANQLVPENPSILLNLARTRMQMSRLPGRSAFDREADILASVRHFERSEQAETSEPEDEKGTPDEAGKRDELPLGKAAASGARAQSRRVERALVLAGSGERRWRQQAREALAELLEREERHKLAARSLYNVAVACATLLEREKDGGEQDGAAELLRKQDEARACAALACCLAVTALDDERWARAQRRRDLHVIRERVDVLVPAMRDRLIERGGHVGPAAEADKVAADVLRRAQLPGADLLVPAASPPLEPAAAAAADPAPPSDRLARATSSNRIPRGP